MNEYAKMNSIVQALSLREIDSNGNCTGYTIVGENRTVLISELIKVLTVPVNPAA